MQRKRKPTEIVDCLQVDVHPGAEEVALATATYVRDALAVQPRLVLCVATGSTPTRYVRVL